MSSTLVLDKSAVQHLLQSPTGQVGRYLVRKGAVMQSRARRNLDGGTGSGPKRIDSGLLRSTIYSELVTVNGYLGVRVGSRRYYAYWVHEGTGVFGPKHHRIYPKRAKFMRWKSKAGPFIYRRSTAGMRGNQFLAKALPNRSLRVVSV